MASIGFLKSSIGKKYLMGLSGFIWVGFVASHMLGNMLIFVGAEAYNKYSHALISNPAIYLAELGLVGALVLHVFLAINLSLQNKKAREQDYYSGTNGEKGVSSASKTMIFHGSLLLAFIVYHLITFKYGPVYMVTYDGVEMRDIFRLVIEVFQSPVYVLGYVACMVAVGIHLSHGVSSIFRSWGFAHPKYTPMIEKISILYAVVVAAGFMAQPIFVLIKGA